MRKRLLFVAVLTVLGVVPLAAEGPAQPWTFAVSGDSRNCGNVVMPAIAADALKRHAAFYWHLGDLRKISGPDEDFIQERSREGKPVDLASYEQEAWDDFIENQIKPWGQTPFYLGIGNHETTAPKTRALFTEKFQQYLDRPDLKEQRLKDDPKATTPKTYFHWMRDGIDFIYLDNATADQFDSAQMQWIRGVLDRDKRDSTIRTIVVGMHEALPESISENHSMNQFPAGIETGRQVYHMLLNIQNEAHKTVYVLASHSHYFMEGTFNTAYWRSNGGVLPGWIVGTAGAQRYPLPPASRDAKTAKTNVYGYLLATVNPEGKAPERIKFEFRELDEQSIPQEVVRRFTSAFVHQCFAGNSLNVRVF